MPCRLTRTAVRTSKTGPDNTPSSIIAVVCRAWGWGVRVDRSMFLPDPGRAIIMWLVCGWFCFRTLPRLKLESFVDFGHRFVGRVEVASEAEYTSGGRTREWVLARFHEWTIFPLRVLVVSPLLSFPFFSCSQLTLPCARLALLLFLLQCFPHGPERVFLSAQRGLSSRHREYFPLGTEREEPAKDGGGEGGRESSHHVCVPSSPHTYMHACFWTERSMRHDLSRHNPTFWLCACCCVPTGKWWWWAAAGPDRRVSVSS